MLVRTWSWAARPSSQVTVTNSTDAELVAASLAGDREAFDGIVQRHQRHVYQLCFRFVGNHEDASDLAQDVFIRAYRGLKNFKGQAPIGESLYRIGFNICLKKTGTNAPAPRAREPLF